ncbi:hypothetical protein COY28_05795, partial [Candidatus Woesearchaeota archaeon CG_4_10_14_0_2_um_filter_57_5]
DTSCFDSCQDVQPCAPANDCSTEQQCTSQGGGAQVTGSTATNGYCCNVACAPVPACADNSVIGSSDNTGTQCQCGVTAAGDPSLQTVASNTNYCCRVGNERVVAGPVNGASPCPAGNGWLTSHAYKYYQEDPASPIWPQPAPVTEHATGQPAPSVVLRFTLNDIPYTVEVPVGDDPLDSGLVAFERPFPAGTYSVEATASSEWTLWGFNLDFPGTTATPATDGRATITIPSSQTTINFLMVPASGCYYTDSARVPESDLTVTHYKGNTIIDLSWQNDCDNVVQYRLE